MSRERKVGKCKRCCPDGGAIFRKRYNDDMELVWKCSNCHLETPIRKLAKPTKPSARQEAILAHLVETFGGDVDKKELIGTKLWIKITNESRHWSLGKMVYGTIGRNGKLKLTLPRCFGDDVEINDMIGANVWLAK